MSVIIDASPLVALGDANDREFPIVQELLQTVPGPLYIPAPVTAEVDYMLGKRGGHDARRSFITDLAAGRFTVTCLDRADYATVLELEEQYEHLELGLADCSIVVMADRYETDQIVTFDERHFRVVTPISGGTFTILPADS